jgi:hypothetical protein
MSTGLLTNISPKDMQTLLHKCQVEEEGMPPKFSKLSINTKMHQLAISKLKVYRSFLKIWVLTLPQT